MILFKDVSYKVLQLTVRLGNTNLSQLNIFKSTKNYIPKLGLTVYAGIIGTSHFVQIEQDNGQIFTELFACETLEDQISEPLYHLPIDALKNPIHLATNSFDYKFKCQKSPYDKTADKITNWAVEQELSSPLVFLEFDFKTPQQELPTSRTILVIHEKKNGITIKTVHEYQEENAIIISESWVVLLSPLAYG